MHRHAAPRRGYCASCEGRITGAAVYLMDEAYCCIGCAHGGPCVCTYEPDMAGDGVTGLGVLAEAEPVAVPEPVAEPEQPMRVGIRGTLL